MAEGNRSQNASKGRRASGRGRSSGPRKRQQTPAREQPRQGPRSARSKKRSAGPKSSSGERSSSLPEATGEEIHELLEVADDAVKAIRHADRVDSRRGVDKASDGAEISALVARTRWEARRTLESADREGKKVREQAQADATKLLDAARRRAERAAGERIDRVMTVTDRLLEELSDLRQQVEALRDAFGTPTETRQKLPAPQQRERISEGARLLALQQMMEGEDAAAIEARLTEQFGVEDPRPITEWLGLPDEKS